LEKARELLQTVIDNPYIGAATIFLLSLLAAVIVDFIIARVLRVLTRRTTTTLDDSFITLIHRPIRVTVVLVGLWLATERLQLPVRPAGWIIAALKTLGTFVWALFAIRFVSLFLKHFSDDEGPTLVEPRTRPLFDNLAKTVFIGLAIYFTFLFWGINVSAWLASAGKRGEVTHIGIRSTRLLTRDDVEVTIPNAVIANAKIVNETGGRWPKERIRVNLSVAYGSDVDRLREVLMEIATKHPKTCDDPEPRVRFRTFGESSINFQLMFWIEEPALRGRVLDALNTAIYKRLREEGIEIPYPKRDLYIRQMPESKPL
jgi:small-conductance mechanosensitive channel